MLIAVLPSTWHQITCHQWQTGQAEPSLSPCQALTHQAAPVNPLQDPSASSSCSIRGRRTWQWAGWALCGYAHIWESPLCPGSFPVFDVRGISRRVGRGRKRGLDWNPAVTKVPCGLIAPNSLMTMQPKCQKCLSWTIPYLPPYPLPLVELRLGQETELSSLRLVNSWTLRGVFIARGGCGRRCVSAQVQVGEHKLQPAVLLQTSRSCGRHGLSADSERWGSRQDFTMR